MLPSKKRNWSDKEKNLLVEKYVQFVLLLRNILPNEPTHPFLTIQPLPHGRLECRTLYKLIFKYQLNLTVNSVCIMNLAAGIGGNACFYKV
uniref:Uncharacterized protein n=1 Tax=Aegilops tauschii subsp. strangulata TaxID=200361 RepID=A0A452ZH35_AEGTS